MHLIVKHIKIKPCQNVKFWENVVFEPSWKSIYSNKLKIRLCGALMKTLENNFHSGNHYIRSKLSAASCIGLHSQIFLEYLIFCWKRSKISVFCQKSRFFSFKISFVEFSIKNRALWCTREDFGEQFSFWLAPVWKNIWSCIVYKSVLANLDFDVLYYWKMI